MLKRASGILLHPTCLPGRFGIGDLGENARQFIDFLAEAGIKLWQVLPLGPTGYGDSPYQCFSAFAGNPLLINLEQLVREDALQAEELAQARSFPDDRVLFGEVIEFKMRVLRHSFVRFTNYATDAQQKAFKAFCNDNASWLEDYALFMALKDAHNGAPWHTWEDDIARRTPTAMSKARRDHAQQILTHKYLQFQFFQQWTAIRAYAAEHEVQIIGDIPIFVAYDSADAWANRELFQIDERGNPIFIAGVPPDYFSPTGQRWGNPLYRWDVMEKQGYAWWIERTKSALKLYDYVRIDHFRGFESYWEVPASEPTAMNGRWVKGPNKALFEAIEGALGTDLPIIAEDLGIITEEVKALRDAFGFPGMRLIHFGFVADSDASFLPHSYIPNCVAYAGTHDNDTTLGWWEKLDDDTRDQVREYLGVTGEDIQWDLVRALFMSAANTVVITMQDILGLGSDARMNFPGRAEGNWFWRFRWEQVTSELRVRLKRMTKMYGR
jgi:4-alpha-glucanotransferase